MTMMMMMIIIIIIIIIVIIIIIIFKTLLGLDADIRRSIPMTRRYRDVSSFCMPNLIYLSSVNN